MDIGAKIKRLREANALTQEELGRQCGTTKQTIFKYESGIVTNIPMNRLNNIASALGVTVSFLMGWDINGQIHDVQQDIAGLQKALRTSSNQQEIDEMQSSLDVLAESLNDLLFAKQATEEAKKPTPVTESGLDDEKLAFIEKLKAMDSETVAALNKLADSIIAKREK